MSSFREQAQQAVKTEDYRSALAAYVAKAGKGSALPDINPHVAELGAALQRHFTATQWGAWMRGVEIYETENAVVFSCPTEFRRQWIEQNFGFNIKMHYRKSVRFKLFDKQKPLFHDYYN